MKKKKVIPRLCFINIEKIFGFWHFYKLVKSTSQLIDANIYSKHKKQQVCFSS
ncbi:hypothetical protein [Nitrosopumilus ureiphilus]|uniref:hypothetical protein n=1 Tax=Nitrosopumilus ureiphilus TaxID=1470067 RepID=UPI0015CA696A|nr:hypothetical protein [Nitrosopumilus ureiphilus]